MVTQPVSISPTSGCAPLTVNFLSSSNATTYNWIFGDGTSLIDDSSVTHVYAYSGFYIPIVALDNGVGCIFPLHFDTVFVYDCTTIESKNHSEKNFILYANPSSNTINISSSSISGKYSLKIYNLLGQQVKQQEIDFSFEGSSKVNIESLASGYYQLMLVNGSNVVSKRFVKE